MLNFFKNLFKKNKLNYESEFVVEYNNQGIGVRHPKHDYEYIKWNDVNQIMVITTDQGPMLCDLWIVLSGDNTSCSIPQGATGFDKLFDAFKKFDNFRWKSFFDAMASTNNNKFICWEKS
ncbi:hypothetical protein A2526_02315 [candidate division WOR-1 bacterium RIFOXYD2_FULL_36_8]|uniref:Uncharacterized protein n=1 Tax=candidate division WOR-1 bacterium RIFOXYB2_FULL_37_13 TaxID=1802579 RepID=A0A1F4SEA1_UNCSA|nr:MAG: hypothetical protein A2310_02520 [candidate division WOR-1 bacterium RIFOXYB2_FULL_37_13]OGC37612.1 MAG: hypothetical protein A2526_02315 [candidate division WOR-1 bacterium RIFOXYD2_FULL_36_8]